MKTRDLFIIALAITTLVFFLLILGVSNPITKKNYAGCEWENLTYKFTINVYEDKVNVYTGIPNCALNGVAQSGLFPSDSKIIINDNLTKEMFEKTLKHEECHQKVFRGYQVPQELTEEQFCIKESEK